MPFTPSVFRRLATFLIFTIGLVSCERGIFESGIDEGVIEYRIEYPKLNEDHVMMDLLPKKMEMTFKNGEYRNEISAGMGLFKTAIIKQKEKEELIHTIKVLNKKLASDLDEKAVDRMNVGFNKLTFEATGNKKVIAEYECTEMIAKVEGDSAWEFKLYFTDEISIDNPNYLSPFQEVKGVLMQYEMINHDLHMLFTAEKVLDKEIKREDILLSDDYLMVTSDSLEEELDAIFEKVK